MQCSYRERRRPVTGARFELHGPTIRPFRRRSRVRAQHQFVRMPPVSSAAAVPGMYSSTRRAAAFTQAPCSTPVRAIVAHHVHNPTKTSGETKPPAIHHPGDPPQMSASAKKRRRVERWRRRHRHQYQQSPVATRGARFCALGRFGKERPCPPYLDRTERLRARPRYRAGPVRRTNPSRRPGALTHPEDDNEGCCIQRTWSD